jgi:hypothetical protein
MADIAHPQASRIETLIEKTEVREEELDAPGLWTLLKMIVQTVVQPVGLVLLSSFFLIMVWGQQGGLQLLGAVWDGWGGPGSDPATRDQIIPGVPWDQEWISFAAGFVLLVVLPILMIRLRFKRSLSDYGLGLPPPNRRRFAIVSAIALAVLGIPTFLMGAANDAMQAEYPLYRGSLESNADFIIYEIGYLLFFVTIEFIFRGYLLFGLFNFKDSDVRQPVAGVSGPLVFGYNAILIAMLSYTAWHLGKPLMELWGTLVWGLATGAMALVARSILLIIVVHWGLNVLLDLAIREGWGLHLNLL